MESMPTALPSWIIATQIASRAVLFILLGLSVWSVAIMVDRYRAFKSANAGKNGANGPTPATDPVQEARKLIAARDWNQLHVWAAKASQENAFNLAVRLPAGTMRAALETGSRESESIDRAVRSYLTLERASLERGLTALATLGSNAPFIGLFGTVLGIIQAFGALGTQTSGGTNSVMSGISEALVATAVGLFVAIPAVVAYNIFSRKLRTVLSECDALRDFYLSRLGTGTEGTSHGR